MNQLHQPRRYFQPISPFWWLRRRSYFLFALRELSCLFVAWFVVSLLLLVSSINAGNDRYQQFLSTSANPWMLLLNMIALLFVVLHAITWFSQTPQVIVVRMHGRRVPRKWIVMFIYLFWAVLSAVVAWTIMGR
jgi:fumarate reductase subunit C